MSYFSSLFIAISDSVKYNYYLSYRSFQHATLSTSVIVDYVLLLIRYFVFTAIIFII